MNRPGSSTAASGASSPCFAHSHEREKEGRRGREREGERERECGREGNRERGREGERARGREGERERGGVSACQHARGWGSGLRVEGCGVRVAVHLDLVRKKISFRQK